MILAVAFWRLSKGVRQMQVLRVKGWMADVELTARDAAVLARACESLMDVVVMREDELEASYIEALGAAMEALARGSVAAYVGGPLGEDYVEECERIGLG